jgi:hypothetical protein
MQSAVDLWEDNKKASIEAKFKGIEVINKWINLIGWILVSYMNKMLCY